MPATKRIGAVSPIALAKDKIPPVVIPAIELGTTWYLTVCHLVALLQEKLHENLWALLVMPPL